MPAIGLFVQYVIKTYRMPMNFHYKGQQATVLDARASRVKWPAQVMSHWYGILWNNDNNSNNSNNSNNNNNKTMMMMMMIIIIIIRMMTMMIIGTTTIMIMIIIITTTLTMTIMKMIMIKTAQTPCQSLYKDRRIQNKIAWYNWYNRDDVMLILYEMLHTCSIMHTQWRWKFENTKHRCLGMFLHKCNLHCSGGN